MRAGGAGGTEGCSSRRRSGKEWAGMWKQGAWFFQVPPWGWEQKGPCATLPWDMTWEHCGGDDGCWFFISALDDFPVCSVLIYSLF